MIHIARAGGPVARVTTSRVGDEVVVAAFTCACPDAAAAVLDTIDATIASASFDFSAVAAIAVEPFPKGAPVRWSVYDWNAGESAIDATVIRRLSDTHLEIRTRMGRIVRAHQRDLKRGRRAS